MINDVIEKEDYTVLVVDQKDDGSSKVSTTTYADRKDALSAYHKALSEGYETHDWARVSAFIVTSGGSVQLAETAETPLLDELREKAKEDQVK